MTLHLFLSPENEMQQLKVIEQVHSVKIMRGHPSLPQRRRYLGGMGWEAWVYYYYYFHDYFLFFPLLLSTFPKCALTEVRRGASESQSLALGPDSCQGHQLKELFSKEVLKLWSLLCVKSLIVLHQYSVEDLSDIGREGQI